MIVTRGKLTVAQAARLAITADCVKCGGQAIFVVRTAKAAVDHRCGTDLVGPTWSLVERPLPAAVADDEAGLTVAEVRAHFGLAPLPAGAVA